MSAHPAIRAVVIALGLAYPVLAYLGHAAVSPTAFILVALALIAVRHVVAPPGPFRLSTPTVLVAGVALIGLSLVDQAAAALAYPSLISFAFASAFGLSLWHRPSLIERIARLRDAALPAAAERYCAHVTLLWTAWLVANGLIAAALALGGQMELWVLWTSLINYLLSGLLLGGEWLFRRLREDRG